MAENQYDRTDSSGSSLWKWLVIGLVTVLVIGIIAVFPRMKPPEPKNRTFSSAEKGLSVSYPNGWTRLSDSKLKQRDGSLVFAVQRTDPYSLLGVNVSNVSTKGLNLRDAVGQIDLLMSRRFKEFKKISAAPTTIKSGQQALRYEYTFRSGTRALHAQALLVPSDKAVYFVSGVARADDYERVKTEIDEFIGSFGLL